MIPDPFTGEERDMEQYVSIVSVSRIVKILLERMTNMLAW